jgi:very-short-patch-repair endonuclease
MFSEHPKSAFWSSKNTKTPNEVALNSHKKFWFDCECEHSFEKRIKDINVGGWCPYCCIPSKKLCSENKNCIKCINKSFASVDYYKNWSNKNKKKPIEVFKSSAEKCWFNCDKCGNEFDSKVSHITDGSWCPKCRYKTEEKFNKILIKKYPSLKLQYKVDWCKNIKHLPFDFVIEDKKIIIEQDGEQHWKQVAKWKTPEHTRNRDLYKMKCANENGFSIIRILQDDIFKDKYDWLTELCENIEKITMENRVQNIYMCKNNEYKYFDI